MTESEVRGEGNPECGSVVASRTALLPSRSERGFSRRDDELRTSSVREHSASTTSLQRHREVNRSKDGGLKAGPARR
ncbi:MAG: hypothetical protein QG622_2561 [Actinomycetota bacterium]|nr:hypothetical protein [Actinomycetota bacterium]